MAGWVAAQRPTGCCSASYVIRKARNGREDCAASETVITPDAPAQAPVQLSLLLQLSSSSVDPPISARISALCSRPQWTRSGEEQMQGGERSESFVAAGADMISGSSRWRRQTADQSFNCS